MTKSVVKFGACSAAVLTLFLVGQAHAAQVVYVPNTTADTVSVIDVDSGAVTSTIPVKGLPFIAAPLADGSKVYIDNLGLAVSGVSVINTADQSVNRRDLDTGRWQISHIDRILLIAAEQAQRQQVDETRQEVAGHICHRRGEGPQPSDCRMV